MKIRTVEKCDKAEWLMMRRALWPAEKEAHEQEIEKFFNQTSIDIENAFIACQGETIQGFLELNVRSFAEGSRNSGVPYIEAWFVKPQFRNQGIGKNLIVHAENWAIERGFSEIASDTTLDNTRSIALHKHLGFQETERVVCFLKALR